MNEEYSRFAFEHKDLILKHFPFPKHHQTAIELIQREYAIRGFILGYKSKEEECK
jgi:hypothetical protein